VPKSSTPKGKRGRGWHAFAALGACGQKDDLPGPRKHGTPSPHFRSPLVLFRRQGGGGILPHLAASVAECSTAQVYAGQETGKRADHSALSRPSRNQMAEKRRRVFGAGRERGRGPLCGPRPAGLPRPLAPPKKSARGAKIPDHSNTCHQQACPFLKPGTNSPLPFGWLCCKRLAPRLRQAKFARPYTGCWVPCFRGLPGRSRSRGPGGRESMPPTASKRLWARTRLSQRSFGAYNRRKERAANTRHAQRLSPAKC
jgi:hypothetical protein